LAVESLEDRAMLSATANDDSGYMTVHDQPLTESAPGVLSNDTPDMDSEGNPLPMTASLVSGPGNGSLVLNDDGSFVYTPNAGFVGTDTFTYNISGSNIATVTIYVFNNAPDASDDSYMVTHDQTLNEVAPGVLVNDSGDMDGDPVTAILVDNVTNGTLLFNPDGTFTYTPNAGYVGSDSFTYKLNDGLADSNIATVTIYVFNNAPDASDDSYMVTHDQTLNEVAPGVLVNDSGDMDGDPVTAILVNNVTNGTLLFNPDGTFTYTPNAGYVGSDSFTYKLNDGLADSNMATVTIIVVNTAPIANDDYFVVAPIGPGESYSIFGVLMNDYDLDGDTLTISLVSGPSFAASFTLNSDGSFVYKPNGSKTAAWPGYDEFVYRVSDGISSAVATAYIDEQCNCSESEMPDDDSTESGTDSGATGTSSTPPLSPAVAPATATISATAFSYSKDPNVANMKPWGFIFTWAVAFNPSAAGKIFYQKIHTRVELKDSAGTVLHWIDSVIVDLSVITLTPYGYVIGDRQDASAFEEKIVNWVFNDRRVCTITFSRHGDARLVDAVNVNPIGPDGVVPYDPAKHGTGIADRHYRDSDGADTHSSSMTPLGSSPATTTPISGGVQLFEDFGQVGNASYRIVWWDKVNSDISRPSRLNPFGDTEVTKRGRLKFENVIGGAAGAAGLPVFPDKPTLNPTVPGGIDRVYGPIKDPL
jgi:hypothetical protein